MIINFTPIRSDEPISIRRVGDSLFLNSFELDFSGKTNLVVQRDSLPEELQRLIHSDIIVSSVPKLTVIRPYKSGEVYTPEQEELELQDLDELYFPGEIPNE